MLFLRHSIDSLSPVCLPICAELAVILASLRAADSDRVVPTLDHLLVALLQAVGPVVPFVLAPLHS
jgi:hypothetical protein